MKKAKSLFITLLVSLAHVENVQAYKEPTHEKISKNAFDASTVSIDTSILDNLGYRNTYRKTLSLGICSIYCGEK